MSRLRSFAACHLSRALGVCRRLGIHCNGRDKAIAIAPERLDDLLRVATVSHRLAYHLQRVLHDRIRDVLRGPDLFG
jgi:hypothetical protein